MPQGITIHDPFQFVAGDTWEIEFDCTDLDNTPLDLTNAQRIEWKFVNAGGQDVITALDSDPSQVVLVIDAVGGVVLLRVPPTTTAGVPAGYYQDQLRVTTSDGRVSTQSQGRIQVLAPLP